MKLLKLPQLSQSLTVMFEVYILYNEFEYGSSEVLGVFSNFELSQEAAIEYTSRCYRGSVHKEKYEYAMEKVLCADCADFMGRVYLDKDRWLYLDKVVINKLKI